MGKVTADISMSLDGFIAGPHDDRENGLGVGGERLHEWLYDLSNFHERHGTEGGVQNQDDEVLDESFRNVGAVIIGRRMFDIAEEAWGDNPPFHVPVHIVTHRPRETLVKEGGTTYFFVTDGIESALRQAQTAADGKDVSIGGANIIQGFIKAGLLDEIQVHVIPVLLGEGRPLFENMSPDPIELEIVRVIASPEVTHLKYRVIKH